MDRINRVIVVAVVVAFLGACGRPPTRVPVAARGAQTTDLRTSASVADYVLAPEDVVDINVWKNEALTRTVFIRPDGKISLPLIGDVLAAGLTPTQLQESIKERLKEFKEMPEVSVVVREIGSFSVYIMGEIARPGKLQLRSDTTIIQAITQAGGFTQFAESNKILILRREGAYETRIRIRYQDIVSGRNPAANIILKRGDSIVIP